MSDISPENILYQSYEVAVAAARPAGCLGAYIPAPPKGKTYVLAAGKAAAEMARVFEDHYNAPYDGIAITRYGHGASTKSIDVIEAAHPVPDGAGVQAVEQMLGLASQAGEDDLVVCLLSGGGSALLSSPIDGLTLEQLGHITETLLHSGAPIHEINAVRKHLNKALGGALAKAAYPARLVTLAISDVVGDDPSVIASGPTVADVSTVHDVLEILQRYKIQIPDLQIPETLKSENFVFNQSEYHLIAAPQKSLEAAAVFFEDKGIRAIILGDAFEGDTNESARWHVKKIQELLANNKEHFPCALISGGETTVTMTGDGEGGPNTQFMLQAAIELDGTPCVYALAADTDGIDGSRDNAGAFITPKTLELAKEKGIDPQSYLERNDSYGFFKGIDALLSPGPTYTNVNDYRAFLLLPESL